MNHGIRFAIVHNSNDIQKIMQTATNNDIINGCCVLTLHKSTYNILRLINVLKKYI